MSNPTLAETQALLWKLITAPEGVEKGLENLAPRERELAQSLVRNRPPLSQVERWDIYANMYFYRIRDCLKEDFGAVLGLIGEANFHNLITDYLLAHPPKHFSLRYAGEHFPSFVATHELSLRWPYLSDLAQLEYAIVDSFDAADAKPLEADELRKVQPEDWPKLLLTLSPTLRLLDLRWPVGELWREIKNGEEPRPIEAENTHMRVWRKGLQVFHKTIGISEGAGLAALARGVTFEAMCEAVAEHGEEGAEAALAMLKAWLADDVLCGLAVNPPSS